jgi:hypothetical protein
MARLIPAVIRGDIKPRLARTVAYMFQTQLQAIHLSQHEYINAFGTDGWRKAVRTSVNVNYDYRFPPDPAPAANVVPPEPSPSSSPTCHPERSEGSCPDPAPPTTDATHHPTTTRPTPAQTSQTKSATPAASPRPQPQPATPNQDPYAVHFDHSHRLRESPKLL